MKLPQFFIAIVACFMVGFGVLVLAPVFGLSSEGPFVDEESGLILPSSPNGLAIAGERVYRDQGCIYCHSQVVTAPEFGPDVEKGWGPRPTVARDYINRKEAYIGIRRFGPDLAFAGWDKRGYTRERIFQHLYDPRMNDPLSNAPTYRFLFETTKVYTEPSIDAIDVSKSKAFPVKEGYQVVPKREAVELVEYVLSLNPNYALPEAPLPAAPEPAAGAAPAPAAAGTTASVN